MTCKHHITRQLLASALLFLVGCGGGPGSETPDGASDVAPMDTSPETAAIDAALDLDVSLEVAADTVPEQVDEDGVSPEDVLPEVDLPPGPDIVEIVEPLPEVHIDTPAPGFVRGTVEVTATAAGDPEVVKVRFLVDDGLLSEDDAVPFAVSWNTEEFDDGDHEIEAIAFDAVGQTASASVLVTVDNTLPDVSFLSPEPGVIQHDEILLAVDASDNLELDHVDLWVDGGGEPVEVSEEPWELLFDGSGLEAGLHTAFASAEDAAGNEAGVFVEFLVDRPPAVALLAPAAGATLSGPVSVQASAADDLGLQGVALAVDGAWEAALVATGEGLYEAQWVPAYEKGERLLTVTAVDGEGQESSAGVTVTVDHPVSVALQICDGGSCAALQPDTELSGAVQLRAVAQDDGAAIAGVALLVDGAPVSEDLEAPYDLPWDTTSVEDGARALEALASNTLDETGSAQVSVLVNNCDLDHDDFTAVGCGGPDCDDGDPDVNPAAADTAGNGADENCDGLDGVDADGDGHASEASGGDDCADDQPLAYPCGDDLPGDGVDGNCDGVDALSCDDCEPCTADGVAGGVCVHGPFPDGAPCDDGDLCTAPGTCQDATCLAGPPLDCDDGNPCTEDACQPASGCAHLALDQVPCPGGTCADGSCCVPACADKDCGPDGCGGSCGACGAEEECDASGQCITECAVTPAAPAMKITTLAVSSGGFPGVALDVDGDPATCAPAGNCAGGMDNQLSGLLNQISQYADLNQDLQGALDGGELVLLADFDGFNQDGAPFVMRMFRGAPLESPSTCDGQAEVCPYLVDHEDFHPQTCAPFAWFDNATVVDGTLTAGGVGYSIHLPLMLPALIADASVDVPFWYHNAQVQGEIVLQGGEPVGLADAVFGAAIPKQSLMDWADALPEDLLPVDIELVKGMIEMFVIVDIDVDGDGTKESASVAVLHDAIPADLVGVTEPFVCAPDCAGKDCGPDGCGGSCGACPCEGCAPEETLCSVAGTCAALPAYDLAELGIRILAPDGQGWGQALGSQIAVSGVAIGDPDEILWETDQGASGSAAAEDSWSTGVPLAQGDNLVTVTAVRGDETASDSLVITYNPAFKFGTRLEIRPGGLFVGEAATLVFRVGMGAYTNFDPFSVTLVECSEDGEWLADVHAMGDNGNVNSWGDEVPGDGVYSWRKNYLADEPGRLCFRVRAHVTAGYQSYDALSPVTCVDAVERITQAQCESAQASLQLAQEAYDLALEGGMAPEEARETALLLLDGEDGVLEAGGSAEGGYGIWLRHESGLLGALRLAPAGLRGGVPLDSRHAAALSPLHAGLGDTDEVPVIHAMMEASSCPPFSGDPVLDDAADLAAWRRLSDHGLVAAATHGEALFAGLTPESKQDLGWHHHGSQELLWTGEAVDCAALLQWAPVCAGQEDCPPGTDCVITKSTGIGTDVDGTCVDRTQLDLARGRIAMGLDRYAVLPSFIERYRGEGYPDSLVYLGACRSMYNGSLGMELLAAGSRAIVGYTGYVTDAFAFEQGVGLFAGLLEEQLLSGEALPLGAEDPDNPGSAPLLLGAGNLDVSGAELLNGSWETGDSKGWSTVGDARVVTRLGVTLPVEGKYMALISTGLGYTPQNGQISQELCIPAGATTLSFYWKYLSEEFKEWCGAAYQDPFHVTLETADGATTILEVGIDALCPPEECYSCGSQFIGLDPSDVSFDQGDVWATPWQEAAADVSALAGQGPVTLRFAMSDQGDSMYDTVALVDLVEFE